MDRLEELLRMKEEIELEIAALEDSAMIDCELNDIANALLEELAEIDEETCPHCTVKKHLYSVYWMGHEDGYIDACEDLEEVEEN